MISTKKAQGFGAWGGLMTIALVMALFGLIVTISSSVQQDITDDHIDTTLANCGTNSTGGSGGTIRYTGCDTPYQIGDASLDAQLKLAEKQSTLVTAGVGIFILSLLIGGFAMYRYMNN